MIKGFKHRGLEKYFARGVKSGVQNKHVDRIRLILGRLNASAGPLDMDLPGLSFHELKGRRKGRWAVRVSANWRITFSFDDLDAIDVDYEDYH